MPQVSKRKLNKNIEDKIYETFWQAIVKSKTNKEAQSLLSDLLSPVELTMLAKRLAIAVLLGKDYTYEDIKETLKVSQETISSVSLTLNHNKGYINTINKISKSQKTLEMIQAFERVAARLTSSKNYSASENLLKKKLGHNKKTLV